VDAELDRLFDEVEAAEAAWREHRLTGFKIQRVGGPVIGTGTADPLSPEWRARHDELKTAFLRAEVAWLNGLTRRP
jgi:hypothetical protein